MKRMLVLVVVALAVVSLAGAASLPELAGAQEPTQRDDSLTVSGVGTVTVVPDEAQMSFGVETRRQTAQAAVSANADAMQKVIAALRLEGAREMATQWVSVYPFADQDGTTRGYVASNSVSAVSDVEDAPALIDAAAAAGANQVSGPGLSSSNAEALYRQALARSVGEARACAEVLAKAAGRSLGEIASIVEAGAQPGLAYRALPQAAEAATPIEPGQQEITATVSVTFSLR